MWDIDQISGIFTGFSQSTSGFPGQLLFQQCFSFILPSSGAGRPISGHSTNVQNGRRWNTDVYSMESDDGSIKTQNI